MNGNGFRYVVFSFSELINFAEESVNTSKFIQLCTEFKSCFIGL